MELADGLLLLNECSFVRNISYQILPFAFDADTYPRHVESQIQINARCFQEMSRGST